MDNFHRSRSGKFVRLLICLAGLLAGWIVERSKCLIRAIRRGIKSKNAIAILGHWHWIALFFARSLYPTLFLPSLNVSAFPHVLKCILHGLPVITRSRSLISASKFAIAQKYIK